MRDLNSLIPQDSGWTLIQAQGINNAGQIVGFGYLNQVQQLFLLTPIPAGPIPIPSNQISVTASGLVYSRVTQTFNGNVTITNLSGNAISASSGGAFQILLTSLAAGVTLTNASGIFNSSPFITVPAITVLAPGQSATVNVEFKNPSNVRISFTPLVYSGNLL